MLAVAALSAGWQALFFGLATLVFLVAFVVDLVRTEPKFWNLIALGLALFAFTFFWNALAAS